MDGEMDKERRMQLGGVGLVGRDETRKRFVGSRATDCFAGTRKTRGIWVSKMLSKPVEEEREGAVPSPCHNYREHFSSSNLRATGSHHLTIGPDGEAIAARGRAQNERRLRLEETGGEW